MQVNTSAVVGVLIALYFSSDSWAHYIPDNKVEHSMGKNESSTSKKERIQICGNALTTLIVEACDGIVGSPDQGQLSRESVQTKITEDCCDRACPLDYLQSYCAQTPRFTLKKTVRRKLLSQLSSRSRSGKGGNHIVDDVKPDKRASHIERHNTINRTWPSIQIGTISPEMDKFGGQPIVVVKKNKSNSN